MSKRNSGGPQVSGGTQFAPGVSAALPANAESMVAGPGPALGTTGGCCCGGQAAADDKAPVAARTAGTLLIDLGNTKCPVMGGRPDGKTFSEWHGLRVGHCCGGCTSRFAADPEKYLNDAQIPWREAADAVKAVGHAGGADRAKALGVLAKKWKVVREPAAEAPAG